MWDASHNRETRGQESTPERIARGARESGDGEHPDRALRTRSTTGAPYDAAARRLMKFRATDGGAELYVASSRRRSASRFIRHKQADGELSADPSTRRDSRAPR